ncbi:MAG: hypothetical protein A4E28_01116 [Methanocella sp. PtaU1.Bin125]|nr:MAG: hypothetical protein A4E28_01116 [Methanocella sp. PtaU1.Bin125]
MMTIDSLYREEDGRVLIEMKLSSVIQLFNTFDPAPFREKELDSNAEHYIVEIVKDFPGKTEFKIVFYLPEGTYDTKEALDIPKAIRAHFEYKTLTQRRKFRERYIFGQFALVVGISFLAIATAASLAIDRYYGSYALGSLIATALEVTGWVAMWEPVTVFLYQLWPIVKERKLYEKISRTEIDIRPYQKDLAAAPEPLTVCQKANP